MPSFVLSPPHDPQTISEALQRLDRRSPTLNILQMRSRYRSWDCANDVHFGGSRRHDCGTGYEVSTTDDFSGGCATADGVNEICPSVRR